MILDARPCTLGEGAFWHPERREPFWFDIAAGKLLARIRNEPAEWSFGEAVSAAGWIDRDRLLIASETGLWRFAIETGQRERIVALEEDCSGTRSNDGRTDPAGGFWISTMGKDAESGAGAIYRFHEGRISRLFANLTIPNAICFAPDGRRAYFADTPRSCLMTVALDAEGWPLGEPALFAHLPGLSPDGAVTDAEGGIWSAQWGAGRVARYRPDGRFDRALDLPAPQVTCPCLTEGGRMIVTSAREGMSEAALMDHPLSGQTFELEAGVEGVPAPRLRL
ncbi:SMP-30/gluconolactonase/LRE family protein [Cereibacter azotoformans]|uniref:Response regulator receiver protein n=1 Tax=Cereibacter sphaeroides (strain ATCC 17025 / ATH 2.4.3) TaxID=349102 RepID=A4WXR7_CERS5|nr:SMP-30/gluconolactonase/LRE family protein [Cereibacter azotoformans]ULB11636.1 SMP-30/gluconolactonase/LRE family protein [Cereibacter azotoformans]